ncbi:CHASE domain-containing protein [Ideonella sp. A 288]|uniref:CHASE domain-containing protein n=1 Tax=Ideonella sp. A 288 TaxID=1962181 RepID=UPI001186EF53|nr:CHASE domain-containing protein [Ideonella sp. A 288]
MPLKPPLLSALPWAVCALSLSITGWLWAHDRQGTQRALVTDFDFGVRHTAGRIGQRLASYEQILRGAQGLFAAAGQVDQGRFGAYVDALSAGAEFAGIQMLGHARWAPGDGQGSAPVVLVAPSTARHLQEIGTNLSADLDRRLAMELARDSGGLGITRRQVSRSDPGRGPQFGFVMFLPVYAAGRPLDSAAARRAALTGWVYANIRMADLMASLHGEGMPGLDVQVHDGVALGEQSLMYQTGTETDDVSAAPAEPTNGGSRAGSSARTVARLAPPGDALEALEYVGLAGHTWTVKVSAKPSFAQHHGGDTARAIALAGIGFSVLLALLTRQLVSGRARAHAIAGAMTRELQASEERYRRIVETADEGIWLTDAQGRTSFVNPTMARLLGCPADELIGRPRDDFIEPPWRGQATPTEPEPTGTGTPRREIALRRRDGALLWASVASSPITDSAGQPIGSLAMVTDITERKQADATRARLELQLRESQKMEAVGTLAGGIAHDFNNILAAILGNVALARQQAGAASEAQTSLEQISKAAVRARSLVQQILAFSRRQPQRLLSQPLRPLVEESVGLLRPLLPALAALELSLTDRPMNVGMDATQIQQVLINLCTNAWHALEGQAGRIVVGLELATLDAAEAQRLGLRPGEHAHLWVSDTGCGMDDTTRARVFEPFFTTKATGQGTGLGLAVVHGIVATHHGTITAQSTPGQGSRFSILLPLLPALPPGPALPPRALPTDRAALPASPGDAGIARAARVLYIDDDPVMVVTVQGLLQSAGHCVTGLEDPRTAMEALRAQPGAFDLVVTDYNMPGLSGLDIAREVAALRPDLPVVITSGYVSDDLLSSATQAGVRLVMQKEYTLEQLGGVVQQVLAATVDAAHGDAPAPG